MTPEWLFASLNYTQANQIAYLAAARLVVDAGKRQHMTPIVKDLHWLPVEERILYKIGILTFQCVRGTGPDYLAEMFTRVSDVVDRASLRSAVRDDFVIPRTNTATSDLVHGVFVSPVQFLEQITPWYEGSYQQFKLKTRLFEQAHRALISNLVNGHTNDCLLLWLYIIIRTPQTWQVNGFWPVRILRCTLNFVVTLMTSVWLFTNLNSTKTNQILAR